MKGFIEEFKTFAMRGNVIDLAVAVVIGASFEKIISSLVENIITPFIGLVLGGINFSGLSVTTGDAIFTYGVFIQSVVDFVIVAFVVFLVVKTMNKMMPKEEEKKSKEPKGPSEAELLTEIRDLLRRNG